MKAFSRETIFFSSFFFSNQYLSKSNVVAYSQVLYISWINAGYRNDLFSSFFFSTQYHSKSKLCEIFVVAYFQELYIKRKKVGYRNFFFFSL